MTSSAQPEFNFDPREPRRLSDLAGTEAAALRQLAMKIGCRQAKGRSRLRGEIRLVGILRLREEMLFVPEEREPQLELIVDNVPFVPAEITSCICAD
jgi:hypothetical protein